ncbi:hypothetical protein FGE25_13205 [Kosakonia sacchari]|nr:hypothetical protein FGE25_13205 [Kosakonia sacchari]
MTWWGSMVRVHSDAPFLVILSFYPSFPSQHTFTATPTLR